LSFILTIEDNTPLMYCHRLAFASRAGWLRQLIARPDTYYYIIDIIAIIIDTFTPLPLLLLILLLFSLADIDIAIFIFDISPISP